MNQQAALSVKQFCERYNLSPATAYRLMSAGALAFRKVGRRRLIAVADAEAWWNSLPGPPGENAASNHQISAMKRNRKPMNTAARHNS